MRSPWCLSGCAEREDGDPFHYYYHVKSAEKSWEEGDDVEAETHSSAALWLLREDLAGGDPYDLASKAYEESF